MKKLTYLALFYFFFCQLLPATQAPLEPNKQGIEEAVTEHSLNINGQRIDYRATAGMLDLREEGSEVKGRIFYTAYERLGVENINQRPIIFCFNGGPGAASIWLHMGVLGPVRVEIKDDQFNPPPYTYVPNEYSLLDVADLVFIDPITTGYSRVTSEQGAKAFHSVDGDIKWLAEWVRLYTTKKGRWSSPKFLLGESYGTFRVIEMADKLHDDMHLYLNGIILISSVLDFQTLDKGDKGNDLPFVLALPSYTAAAWYHGKLAKELQALSLERAIEKATSFAVNEYSVALLLGDLLGPERKKFVAKQLSYFTGLSADYIEKSNLRVPQWCYAKELLRAESKVIGRFDSRFAQYSPDNLAQQSNYDPSLNAILGIFTATANSYFEKELNWFKEIEYRILTSHVHPWDYSKYSNKYLNATPTLRDLLVSNPDLTLFVASGYYDLATTYYATVHSCTHLNLDEVATRRLTMKNYEGGHMMYLSRPLLEKLSQDLHRFISNTLQKAS